LHAGAVVSVRSRVLEVKERSLRFEHEMIDDANGEPAARTVLKAVHLDAALRKSVAFEATIVAKAHALLAPPSA
jgi:acyl-CoA thioester hydrolase